MTSFRMWLAAVLAASGASTFACGGDNSASEGESVGRGIPAASAGHEDLAPDPPERLSDPQIASVTTAANAGEVAQAKAALPKLTDANAMQFAEMMIDMHTAAQQRQDAMAQERGLTPEAHPLSTELARTPTTSWRR